MMGKLLLVLLVLHGGFALAAIYHSLLYKRDPRAALSWILVSAFLPLGGAAYFAFGINRIARRGRISSLWSVAFEVGEAQQFTPNIEGRGIDCIGHRVTGQSASDGNQIETYFRGEDAYDAMCRAIDEARQRAWLSTFIFKVDQVGERFSAALKRARDRGVDVRVIIDGVGERYGAVSPSAHLRRLGVPVVCFLPPRLLPPGWWLNLRNHRKLLLIDADCAFCGGINISEDHTGSPPYSADVQFAFHGPVVADLAHIFANDWLFATGETLLSSAPSPSQPGQVRCRVIADGPDERLDALALTITTAISAAQDHVNIMVPYFLPGRALSASLQSAALRGVAVRVILPERSNLRGMDWAQRNGIAELLRWGVSIYFQPTPFCHAKLLQIDDRYLLIGSANLDPRSLRLNFEVGVEVFSPTTCSIIQGYFEKVLERSQPATESLLNDRSIPARLRDSAAALFSPYL